MIEGKASDRAERAAIDREFDFVVLQSEIFLSRNFPFESRHRKRQDRSRSLPGLIGSEIDEQRWGLNLIDSH